MSKTGHYCYLPTNNLCHLAEHLSDEFFPNDEGDIFRQEIVTYRAVDGVIRKTTFVRRFYKDGKHDDGQVSEVIGAGL